MVLELQPLKQDRSLRPPVNHISAQRQSNCRCLEKYDIFNCSDVNKAVLCELARENCMRADQKIYIIGDENSENIVQIFCI